MKPLPRLLFSFTGEISRAAYIVTALVCVLAKHLLDVAVAWYVFGRSWDPLSYVMPLGVSGSVLDLSASNMRFMVTMLALAAPFAWIGLAITTKRFRAIGWPLWIVVLFFVPVANIASFALAAAWPDSRRGNDSRPGLLAKIAPHDRLGAAVLGIVGAAVLSLLLALVATHVLTAYGWGLFAAVPFAQGALATVVFNAHERRTLLGSIGVASLSVVLAGTAMIALFFEGAICVIMALPIALFFAALGALFAYAVTRQAPMQPASLLLLILMTPAFMGADAREELYAPLHLVQTEIAVDAAPATVWNRVMIFPALRPPTELLFRVGIAYPVRAKIVGTGKGATRYCEFSTGDFVEPITAWDPGRRLAFDVVKNPLPMREWTPYGRLDTPHLHGFLEASRGEFVLQPLPGGRTLLIGRTWYRHHLWPDAYWTLWSDAIIHTIHDRVLEHIKRLAETGRVPVAHHSPQGISQ